jgi:hypothetical protein
MITPNLAASCRWTARIIAALMLGLFLFFAIGEGLPNLLTVAPVIQAEFVAFALIFGGIVVGWRWELVGGLLSLLSAGLFYVAVLSSGVGNRSAWWPFVALALPGALLITSAFLRRADIRRSKP